jgi:large subunit ribosomal protein L21
LDFGLRILDWKRGFSGVLDIFGSFVRILAPKILNGDGMYAIIEDSGTQFKVTSGDRIRIDRADVENFDAKTVTFDKVLFVGGEGTPKIGTPVVAGATVTADVIGVAHGPRIDIQKYKRRKGYHKKIGHRQSYLEVRISGING